MLIVPNHHAIVPITRDIGIEVPTDKNFTGATFQVDLFGDSVLCGRDPDLIDPECGCRNEDLSGAVPQPPARLLEIFLPQFRLEVVSKCSGLSTSVQLLDGTDGVNSVWPTSATGNIIVINHGLNDARFEVDLIEYKQILIDLREAIEWEKEVVWLTPTKARGIDVDPYAAAMRQVAAQYGDILADSNLIKDWLHELPDGTHPRQLGYAELVELCLAPAVNNAIVRLLDKTVNKDTMGPYSYLRQDLQAKFVMSGERQLQLPFTPKSASWVEVYHRDNISYRAVSRGYLDTKGILTSGIWNADTTEKLVNTGRSYNLSKIKRDRGDIVFSKNYDIYGNPADAIRLANDLNQTNDDYIVVITTHDEPKGNRLSPALLEAMYRCGASERVFGSANFKFRSSYILVGIPGIGQGNGHEAYNGMVDATEANIAPYPTTSTLVTRSYYPIMTGNQYWSPLLNDFAIWDEDYHATLITVDGTNSANIAGSQEPFGVPLDYDEGATATTANWNNPTTFNMTNVSGLGPVLMHGYTPNSTYTFTYNNLTPHSQVRYQVYWHFVDSVDFETCRLSIDGQLFAEFRRFYDQDGATFVVNQMATATWTAATYSYAPYGTGRDGYIIFDTGWINHTSGTFTASHQIGLDQPQFDEAVYLSHVRLRTRAAGSVSNAVGILNFALTKPIARWVVNQDNEILDSIGYPSSNLITTASNTVIVETPDCKDLAIQFGVQGQSYLRVTNDPKLVLTANVITTAFTIEAVIWPIEDGGGGMIINKDSEYELRISDQGNVWVALDWGVGTDTSLPGGGWYYTPVQVPFNEKSHIAWVVNGTQFEIFVNGVLEHLEIDLDRVNANNGNDLYIGNRLGLSDQFTGYIIDLRIWDRALGALELEVTKNYLEYTNLIFNYGVAPLLENFIPTNGTKPNDDLVIIGRNVTENELNTLGIYKTKADVLVGVAGDEVSWECYFNANKLFRIGYWLWDARKQPTNANFVTLYNYDAEEGYANSADGIFVIPSSFNEKSIIVFGVGDVNLTSPTGFSNVSLEVAAKRISTRWSGNSYYWDVFFSAPDFYTFELSTDNVGTLYIQKNPTLDITETESFANVVEVTGTCQPYKEAETKIYQLEECGWHRIKIYAENSLDLVVPPTFYTAYTFTPPVTPVVQFLNTYGVTSPDNSFNWDVLLDENVLYTLEIQSIMTGATFKIKELVDDVVTDYKTIISGGTQGPIQERSFTTNKGYHNIKIEASNNIIVAARLRTPGGKTIWNTRSLRNPRETDYKGVAARIKDRYNRTIWTTRSAINQKDFNSTFRERNFDPSSAYSEIEFEISPHGTVIPVDIFPPRYEYLDANSEIQSMTLSRDYDIVKNFPPVNGTRIVNHRYYSSKVATHPEKYRVTHGNKIVFDQPMHGVITVLSDTLAAKNQIAAELIVENIHSMDYYRKRFNPARWAPGSNVYPLGSTVFGQPPGSTGTVRAGNTAPRVANSASITNQILEYDSIYNTGLNFRVGDSHYAEPVILSQPMMGYARLSQDRKTVNYTPFAGAYGFDSFAYTLISQHGQEGLPKNVYVRIVPDSETGIKITATKSVFNESDQKKFVVWDVYVPTPGANVRMEITGGTASAIDDYQGILYSFKSDPLLKFNATPSTVINLTGDLLVELAIVDDDSDAEVTESVIISMISDSSGLVIATGTAYIQD